MVRKKKQSRITDFFNTAQDANISIELTENSKETINFFQINNQKRIMSNEEIMRAAEKSGHFCIIGQEPSTFGFNVTGVNSQHIVIQAPVDKPRSYIVCHKLLNAWPVMDLCSRDVATAIVDSNDPEIGKFLITSIYWDGRINSFPSEARAAAKFAREKDYTFVCGGDVNARNTLFGSDSTDKRGLIIEDLMVEFDLETANKGNKPTCTASHPGSVIDATFISGEKAHWVENWRVTDDETFSDHKLIRFEIRGPQITHEKRRKMNPIQKESFTRETRALAHNLLDEHNQEVIGVDNVEELSSKIIQGLIKAHADNSTQYIVKIREKKNLWFDKDLTAERKKHRALKHIYEHSNNDPAKKAAWKKQEQKLTHLYNKA